MRLFERNYFISQFGQYWIQVWIWSWWLLLGTILHYFWVPFGLKNYFLDDRPVNCGGQVTSEFWIRLIWIGLTRVLKCHFGSGCLVVLCFSLSFHVRSLQVQINSGFGQLSSSCFKFKSFRIQIILSSGMGWTGLGLLLWSNWVEFWLIGLEFWIRGKIDMYLVFLVWFQCFQVLEI